jgi:hypothetical protein
VVVSCAGCASGGGRTGTVVGVDLDIVGYFVGKAQKPSRPRGGSAARLPGPLTDDDDGAYEIVVWGHQSGGSRDHSEDQWLNDFLAGKSPWDDMPEIRTLTMPLGPPYGFVPPPGTDPCEGKTNPTPGDSTWARCDANCQGSIFGDCAIGCIWSFNHDTGACDLVQKCGSCEEVPT